MPARRLFRGGVLPRPRLHEQPPIDERLRRAEDDVAVGIVLELLVGEIAGAHGPHAVIPGQRRHHPLGQFLFETDAVDRLDVTGAGGGDDVHHPTEIKFHRAHRRERVQRAHDEERVPDPAEAVVPVAPRAGGLGNAGRHRGDDGAGRLVAAQFQRDRGADHGILPFERQCEPVHPFAPVVERALLEVGAVSATPSVSVSSGPKIRLIGVSSMNGVSATI